ncbi:MAG: MATE family efflux transporter [Firmicutes bacterium]|nr:MATE family efflux transporter [Bacillota bacterium]
MDMCSGSVLKKMLIYSLPLMFSGILQLLFNAADIVVVGRFAGDNSLAAVGSTGSLINLLTNLFIGLSVGANVLTAKYYGAKKSKLLTETVHTSMMLSIISGIFLTVVGVLGAHWILHLMNTPDEVLGLATVYLRIYFLGMPAMMVYNFGSAILRAVGDTRRPLYILAVAGVINVILNLIFVIAMKMDVAGVAAATSISQFISAGLIVRCMMQGQGSMRLRFKLLMIHWDILKRILRIGIPAGLSGILFSISNVFIQAAVNGFGNVVMAGNSAASNVEGFVYVAMNAFYQANLSFTSQNVGAGRYDRVNKILIWSLVCVTVTGVVLGNLVYLFGHPLLSIYSPSEAVIEAGIQRFAIICTTYALGGIMDTLVGALRGLGHSVLPMLVTMVGVCGLRLLWIGTGFRLAQFHTTTMLYMSYPVTWTLTSIVHIICYIVIMKKIMTGLRHQNKPEEA